MGACRCSTDCNDIVVTLYIVESWGHPADLWHSAVPLELNAPAYEPELHPLSLSVGNVSSPDHFDVCVENKKLVFHAGDETCRLDLAPYLE